jgi:uncharacterized protein
MPGPENTVKIAVRVYPNAQKNEVVGFADGVLKLKIAAHPEKGKANKELIEFLSDKLEIRKSDISILKGETSHNKLVSVARLTNSEVIKRLGF